VRALPLTRTAFLSGGVVARHDFTSANLVSLVPGATEVAGITP